MERETHDLNDPADRGQNVDPDNTYTTQNKGATMRPPRAEERAAANEPETRETRAGDGANRVESNQNMAHANGGRDANPAVRNQKQVVADSDAQRPNEAQGDEFEPTGDSADKDRHAP